MVFFGAPAPGDPGAPDCGAFGWDNQWGINWTCQVWPYGKNAQMYFCPSAAATSWTGGRGYMTAYSVNEVHFVCNHCPWCATVNCGAYPSGDYNYADPCENRHLKFTEVEYPGETVFFAETGTWNRQAGGSPRVSCPFMNCYWDAADSYWPEMRGEPVGTPPDQGGGDQHNDGGNYAFVDGHAKWMKRSQAASGALLALAGTTWTSSSASPSPGEHREARPALGGPSLFLRTQRGALPRCSWNGG